MSLAARVEECAWSVWSYPADDQRGNSQNSTARLRRVPSLQSNLIP